MISGMERVVLITSLIGCIIVWHSVNADITFNPRDTESRVNDSTYFNCSTDILSKQIHWSHDGKYVYAGGVFYEPYLGRFQIEINNSTGAYNLIIPSVESQDVGEYSCQDDGGHGKISSAKLIVLADEPTCHTVPIQDGNSCGIVPDKVLLSCSVIFHGSIPPNLEWRKTDGTSLIPDVTSVVSGNSTTYTTTLKTDLSMDRQSYLCQTTKSVTSQYKCQSETIRLQYVFNGTERINATIDEEVKCSANSSQSCSYKWFNGSDSVTVSTDQTFKPMKGGFYRCEATCHIGNKSCIVNVMFVEVYSTQLPEANTGQYSMVLLILLVAVVLIVIVVIVAGSLLLYLKRKRANERVSGSKQLVTNNADQTMSLIASTAEDKEHSLAEPDEGHKEEVVTSETDQSMPLTAVTADDKDPVKQNLGELEQGHLKGLSILEGKPEFVTAISRHEEVKGKSIAGVTALKDEIFVASKNSRVLEIYGAANKYALVGTVPIPEMVNPFDLASCVVIECVFIVDFKLGSEPKEIIRMKSSLKVEKRWSTGDDFGNLSVSSESNIILSVFGKNKLIEYTKDGEKVREITLPVTIHPRHAIKLTNGQFVISYGHKNDVLHQVSIVKMNGEVLKLVNSFGGEKGTSLQQLNQPKYLIVDEQGSILVLDFGNKRVLLLDSNLESKLEFLTTKTRLHNPDKMCLCKATCNLFIIDKVCNLLVFSIK